MVGKDGGQQVGALGIFVHDCRSIRVIVGRDDVKPFTLISSA